MKIKLRSTVVLAVVQLMIFSRVHAGGLVAAWGDNTYGQVVLPNGLINVKAIAAGQNTCPQSIALWSDGTVVAWPDTNDVPAGLSDVTAVAQGYYFRLALKSDGHVVAWGYNGYGQADVPGGLTNAVAIAAGLTHSLALTSDGRVVAWGSNWVGQTNVPPGLSKVVTIAAGEFHSLALKADGTVVAWGHDSGWGETQVPVGLSNVVAIAAGENHSLALKADGTVISWGATWVAPPSGLSNITAISASFDHSLALKADGSVVAWGSSMTNVPTGMSNATAIAAGGTYNLALVSDGPPMILTNPQSQTVAYPYSNATFSVRATGREPLSCEWLLNGVAIPDDSRIHGSTNATLSISNLMTSDIGSYTVLVSNAFGCVLSLPATLAISGSPLVVEQPISRTVRAGSDVQFTVSAIGTSPLSYQWFNHSASLVGASNAVLLLTNVQPDVSGVYYALVTNTYGTALSMAVTLTVTDSAPYIVNQPANHSGYMGYSTKLSVSAKGSLPLSYQWRFDGADIPGATNAMLTLTNLTSAQAGYYHVVIGNAFGQVISAKALLTLETANVVVWGNNALTDLPLGLTNLVAVAGGYSQIVGLKSDGTIKVWTTPNHSSLTNVPPAATNVIAVAAGIDNFVLKSDGTIVKWGGFPAPTPAGLSNVLAIAEKNNFALALKSNNTVVAWGDNRFGQTNVPPGLSNVVAIAAGVFHGLAAKADGSVVAWGNNQNGQTNVPAGLTNVIAVAGGSYHSLALKADGTVAIWGNYPPFLEAPAGLSNIVAIAAGYNQNLALKADGSLLSWSWGGGQPLPSELSNVFAVAAGGPPGISGFNVALTGDGSPHITVQPMSQNPATGTNVQLHARAVGVQPMRYQWQWNGQDLPGATNDDLTIAGAPGDYRMIAANALGSAISRVAQVGIPFVPFNTNLDAALNATNLVWSTFSYNRKQSPAYGSWFAENQVTHDDTAAVQSGAITNTEESTLQTTVTGPGTLAFWWKVSSEADYDFLKFYLDGANAAAISGEADWQKLTFTVPPGNHTLRWSYSKDASVSAGQDAGWLDQVTFTPAPLFLSAPRLLSDGSFAFAASTTGGEPLPSDNVAAFEVQASTNLLDWVTVPEALATTNGMLQLRDPAAAGLPMRFYRIVQQQN